MAQKRLSSSQTDWQAKQENLLIAIDQLEQLTEVMGEVLTRVKQQVETLENEHPITDKTLDSHKISNHKKSKPHSKAKKRSIVH